MLQAVSFFFLAKLLHANVVFACKPPATSRVFSRTVLISCCNIFICNRAGWDKNRGTRRILRGKADCKQSTVTQDWRMDCGLGPGGVLPFKRLIVMCRWMGSHFHALSHYNGVAFSKDLLEWGRKFSDFLGK